MQASSVEDYVEAHLKIFQCTLFNFDAESDMIRNIFMWYMKPYLCKLMDISQCKLLSNTYVKACNVKYKAHSSICQN